MNLEKLSKMKICKTCGNEYPEDEGILYCSLNCFYNRNSKFKNKKNKEVSKKPSKELSFRNDKENVDIIPFNDKLVIELKEILATVDLFRNKKTKRFYSRNKQRAFFKKIEEIKKNFSDENKKAIDGFIKDLGLNKNNTKLHATEKFLKSIGMTVEEYYNPKE